MTENRQSSLPRIPELPWRRMSLAAALSAVGGCSFYAFLIYSISRTTREPPFWTHSPSDFLHDEYECSLRFMGVTIVSYFVSVGLRHPLRTDAGELNQNNCFMTSLARFALLFLLSLVLVTNKRSLTLHIIFAFFHFFLYTSYEVVYVWRMGHDLQSGTVSITLPASILMFVMKLCCVVASFSISIYAMCLFLFRMDLISWSLHVGAFSFNFTFFEWLAMLQMPIFDVFSALWPMVVAPPTSWVVASELGPASVEGAQGFLITGREDRTATELASVED